MGLAQRFHLRRLRRQRGAFRELFGPGPSGAFSPAQQIVLAELKRFCHADTSTFDPDPRVHAYREGRREVWLRVQSIMGLTDEQIAAVKEIERDDDE